MIPEPQRPPAGGTASDEAPVRILLVDDEESILRSLIRELRDQPWQLAACQDPYEALEAVKREHYSLIITDNRMPGMTGVELLERVKAISPDTTRIILTGYTDLDSAIRAINQGGINFYITKPWEKARLLEHIHEGLEKHRLRAENRRLTRELEEKNALLNRNNQALKEMAVRDRMTGLYNHAEFQAHLARQLKLHRRDRQPFCLALGDIDDFKRVNDTHGHPAGDAVIRAIARVLAESLREEVDTIYRYGGEEFAVLLRNTRAADGLRVMERLLRSIEATPVPLSGGALHATMSFGLGECGGADAPEALVQRVDRALYEAKRAGKNRVAGAAVPAE